MITCKNESVQYQTIFSNGTHSALSDTTEDKGGNNTGFRPHELLEAALATCLNMHVRMYANTHRYPLEGIKTTVVLDRSHQDEVKFMYAIGLNGPLSSEQKERLYHIANTCPVHKTLSKVITIQAVEPIE